MIVSETEIARRLRENVVHVQERIAQAAARSGRRPADITLVGVSKYVDSQVAGLLYEAGVENLGESRPQELWRKAAALADKRVSWHLIGHLQRNKVKRTVPLVACIQSVDSLPLLQDIDAAVQRLQPLNVLLEVNISGDDAKHGLAPDTVEPLFPEIQKLNQVKVLGLMTMAALEGGLDRARRDFAALRELAERLRPKCSHNILMNELSMGMSGDYEVAIGRERPLCG
jgi:pyridoxal phosphate enzyme (YggS family)